MVLKKFLNYDNAYSCNILRQLYMLCFAKQAAPFISLVDSVSSTLRYQTFTVALFCYRYSFKIDIRVFDVVEMDMITSLCFMNASNIYAAKAV